MIPGARMNNMYIKKLGDTRINDRDIVGEKAAALGELIQHQIRSPEGFCITVPAFRYFLEYSGANRNISNIVTTTHDARNQRFPNIEMARQKIKTTEIPDEIASAIKDAYFYYFGDQTREKVKLAIRSSAVVKDSILDSFEDQFGTYLAVDGFTPMLSKVRDCWASVLNESAIKFAQSTGYNIFGTEMGILVQEMVSAEKSGLLFTTHTTSGDQDQMVIDATWGLVEISDNNSVYTDSFVVDKTSLQILDKRIANQQASQFLDTKINQDPTANQKPDHQHAVKCLAQKELQELIYLGKKIENILQYPQLVKWVINQKGIIFVLQTMPISLATF